jgi:hypothetical protein
VYISNEHVFGGGGGGGDDPGPNGPIPRRSRKPSRATVLTVGVVTLLIAAIAVTNGVGRDDDPAPAASGSAAASDDKPGAAPAAHSRAGARTAATGYAERLGSADMFNEDARHALVADVAAPDRRAALSKEFDSAYTAELNQRIGLDEQGQPPAGQEFVNETLPARSTVTTYTPDRAVVDVWCAGVFGFKGEKVKTPVETNHFTLTITLVWSGDAWKFSDSKQTEDPTG